MKRYLDDLVASDLRRKMVLITGPRQLGKKTLCRHLMARFGPSQYLNWYVAADRAILRRQGWNPRTRLLAMDEIHKMPDWKNWLKGMVDGRSPKQALLVTGIARMETWRQSGDSLAGRYLAFRLHFRSASGASNRAAAPLRPLIACWHAAVSRSRAWRTTRTMPNAGGFSISPISSARM